MATEPKYDPDFERIWNVYPKFPKGRSKKVLAGRAFDKQKKLLKITTEEVSTVIIPAILERSQYQESWQSGNQYGPPALQVWIGRCGWTEDYVAKRNGMGSRGAAAPHQQPHWQREGYASFDDYCRQKFLEDEKRWLAKSHANGAPH